ncbi:MAG: precorrin-6y C5,15-methyltransferase (decarboxylating) subunit CbiE [Fretibacterium sp.]|nr:precorrin-6y C5,15-methyltransferase (decarboxylating) subunit CbiE [Fretibacterium sp.]
MEHELYVVGVGPGAASLLTVQASELLRRVDCVVAAPRHSPLVDWHPNRLTLEGFSQTLDRVEKELERGSVAILVSGDPGLFSLLPWLTRNRSHLSPRVLPGVSSLQSLCAAVGETWESAAILSGHGRPLSEATLLNSSETRRLSVVFCGADRTPQWVCETLAGRVDRVEVVVGERLSYPDERVRRGSPREMSGLSFDPLALVLVRNLSPWTPPFGRIRDADFERSSVPMTREEVRSVILDRLELCPGSVLWDIGAGTGSVSVSAALACPECEVHAVEFLPEALELTERNRLKFRRHNMTVHEGRALALLDSLPPPTHVFIGGSGGELRELLERIPGLMGLQTGVRVMVSAVTLETLGDAVALLSGPLYDGFDAVQLCVSSSKTLGQSHALMGRNPVTLLSAQSRLPKKNHG